MIINADKIGKTGLTLSDSIEMDENLLIEEDGFFLQNLNYNIFLTRDGEKIKAKGKIRTSVSLKCVRCLVNFELKINSSFDIILFPTNLVEFSNVSLNADDMEYIFFEGDKIDLLKILMEQVNLFIPFNPICNRDCKGICPVCGMNINYEKCKCESSLSELNSLFDKIKR
jgi:uncharacterized protein